MTQSKIALLAILLLLDLVGCLLIIAVQMAAIFEAQRKELTAFRRWLVPFTLASIVFLAAQFLGAMAAEIISVMPPNLGISPYLILLCPSGLNVVGTALALIAAFQLWKIIRGWPVGAEAGTKTPPGGSVAGRQPEDVWPPPPTDLG